MTADDEPTNDPHVLDPEHLPTPFSAAEIRDAAPSGYTVEVMTESGGEVERQRIVFVDCDAEGARMWSVPVDDDGEPIGEESEGSARWTDLQAHASFPAAMAVRERETIDHALGRLDCWRYEATRPDVVMTFWFSLAHPGMPVRYESAVDGVIVSTTSVTAIRRPE